MKRFEDLSFYYKHVGASTFGGVNVFLEESMFFWWSQYPFGEVYVLLEESMSFWWSQCPFGGVHALSFPRKVMKLLTVDSCWSWLIIMVRLGSLCQMA